MPKKKKPEPAKKIIVNPTARQLPPPPAPKKLPPPPPPVTGKAAVTDFKAIVKGEQGAINKGGKSLHIPPPADVTHYEFIYEGGGTQIVGPAKAWVDHALQPGKMRYGKLLDEEGYNKGKPGSFRYHPDFEPNPRAREQQAEVPGAESSSPTPGIAGASKPPKTRAPGSGKREGVCGFIDALILEGGRSVDDILAVVMEKFPTRDPAATKSTIRCRPSHIKKAHANEPNFKVPPFAG